MFLLAQSAALFVVFFYAWVCQGFFFAYLRATNTPLWKSLNPMGTGTVNLGLFWLFLKNDMGEENPRVLRYKNTLRGCVRLLKIIGIGLVVNIALICVCAIFQSGTS